MDNVMVAFLFGGLSALSLPLAALGLWLRPGLRFTAAVMAFGAGALLCALAIEIVVPSLEHFPDQPTTGFVWLASGALFGCLLQRSAHSSPKIGCKRPNGILMQP